MEYFSPLGNVDTTRNEFKYCKILIQTPSYKRDPLICRFSRFKIQSRDNNIDSDGVESPYLLNSDIYTNGLGLILFSLENILTTYLSL